MFIHATSALVLATSLLPYVHAHTYMIQPKGRIAFQKGFGDSLDDGSGNWSGLCHIGDGSPVCCNAPKMSSSQMQTYKRGDEIPTHWWRNNHVGGFTRYSIVPVDKSDSQDNFDAAENVRSYGCNQVGCSATYGGQSPNNWNGGDSNGDKTWSNPCSGSFKVPYDLADGVYTVQWIWFGTGNAPSANSPFQTCVDFTISGGPTGAKPKCPLWKGGDLSEKSKNACVYVSVNNPTYQGVCASANACQGSYEVGVPQAIADCEGGKSSDSYPLQMAIAPNGFPDTFTSYSASGSSKKSGNSTSSGDDTDSGTKSGKSSASGDDTDSDGSGSGSSKPKKSKPKKPSKGSKSSSSSTYDAKLDVSSKNSSYPCMQKKRHNRRAIPARLGKRAHLS